jgi:hypothetical protein
LDAVNFSSLWAKLGGLPNVRFANNLFSSDKPFTHDAAFGKDAALLGAFDYNFVRGTSSQVTAKWFGPNNIVSPEPIWHAPELALASISDSLVTVLTGIDLSRPFMLQGFSHPPLPGLTLGYFSGDAPTLGAVQTGTSDPTAPKGSFTFSMEATAGLLQSPMTLSSTPLAQQSVDPSHVYSPVQSSGSVTFQFEVPTAGNYVVWCRVFAANWLTDAFSVSVNGGPAELYASTEGGDRDSWYWSPVNSHQSGLPYGLRLFQLNQGINTIRFQTVDSYVGLARIIVTDDASFTPDGTVRSNHRSPDVTLQRHQDGTTLHWPSVPGKNYHVFYKDHLAQSHWLRPNPINFIRASQTSIEWADQNSPHARFYLVYEAP